MLWKVLWQKEQFTMALSGFGWIAMSLGVPVVVLSHCGTELRFWSCEVMVKLSV
jgi:hypothetical protein